MFLGSGNDDAAVRAAAAGVGVIVSAAPPDPSIASALGRACKDSPTCQKVIWTAGASNIPDADGKPSYLLFGPAGEAFYRAHKPCVDALVATGSKYVIWCPGRMARAGRKLPGELVISTRAVEGMDFVSYEDAAAAIVTAAGRTTFDGQHITAATKRDGGEL